MEPLRRSRLDGAGLLLDLGVVEVAAVGRLVLLVDAWRPRVGGVQVGDMGGGGGPGGARRAPVSAFLRASFEEA